MLNNDIVICSSCGTKNRVPKNVRQARCGKCKRDLAVVLPGGDANFSDHGFAQAADGFNSKQKSGSSYGWFLILVFAVGVYLYLQLDDPRYRACAFSAEQNCFVGMLTNEYPPYTAEEKEVLKAAFLAESKLTRLKIQYALQKKKLYEGVLDGEWGGLTSGAISEYGQAQHYQPIATLLFKELEGRLTSSDEAVLFEKTNAPVRILAGETWYRGSGNREAPFSVEVGAGEDYFIKVKSASTAKEVLGAYILGGTKFKTKLPLGSYELSYASGDLWYGEEFLFGPNTDYSKADKSFQFTKSGRSINGVSVKLVRVVNGNLKTKNISKDDF
jgi:hypothetical protein